MNGRIAKRLRREAERRTVGKPGVSHGIQKARVRKGSLDYEAGILRLGDCTRRAYKRLKRMYILGQIRFAQ